MKSVSSATNLDALLSAHASFLERVVAKSLLDSAGEEACHKLKSLLANMHRLPPLVARLADWVSQSGAGRRDGEGDMTQEGVPS
jgi:hypothetical protein